MYIDWVFLIVIVLGATVLLKKVFYVVDRQNGNLGNIENDTFKTLQDVCDRMGAYHNDYLYRAVEEDEELSLWDLASIYLVENSDFLSNCDVNNFKKYLKDKNIVEQKRIGKPHRKERDSNTPRPCIAESHRHEE